ncbi:hypothetical protein FI667_g2790, partial [Globisporangium splendens]
MEDIPRDSSLYADCAAGALIAAERHHPATRKTYSDALSRFQKFCIQAGFPDPMVERSHLLPYMMVAHMTQLSEINKTAHPAEKLRSAVANCYSGTHMTIDGHPSDRWEVRTDGTGILVGIGNPAKSAIVRHFMTGLNKVKKRSHVVTRATPMALDKLQKMHDYVETHHRCNVMFVLRFEAVSAIAFFGMCRISEAFSLRKKNLEPYLTRLDKETLKEISFRHFALQDRKTDHDPSAMGIYNMYKLPNCEKTCDILVHLRAWYVLYLLDDVMDREEGELSDVFAPDRRITRTCASEEKRSNSTIVPLDEHSSVVMELQAIRSEMSALKRCFGAAFDHNCDSAVSQVTHQANAKRPQLSSLPEAATWKDYVTQYWTADPSRHQFRAGCDFTAEEKRHYKTRLSRMKLTASYVRYSFDDDVQNCERFLQSQLGNELAVNVISKYLLQKKKLQDALPSALLIDHIHTT